MGLFGFLRKNKNELTEEQKKWNKVWDLWVAGQADPPYAELMTYQSELNNGGHYQFFSNIESTGDLQKVMTVLDTVLPAKLQKNLQKAYKAYLVLEKTEADEKAEAILEKCDDLFYENDEVINGILGEYATKITLSR